LNRRTFGGILFLVLLIVWPQIPGVPYDLLNTAILMMQYLVVVLSLVLLIGIVGQISLGQASLVGMGAFVAALATNHFGLHFPWTLVVGTTAGAVLATLLGLVALRVRGLYLAVATLIFAYVCDRYLFAQTWLVDSLSGVNIAAEHIGTKGSLPYFDLTDAHIFYYPAIAIGAATLYALANLRDSRLGRAFSAIRGSEVAAASLGINVMRYKLLAFAIAGGMAGLGGALSLAARQTVAPGDFNFTNSLYFLSMAVVGGLQSLGGAVASCAVFAVLVGEVFLRFPKVADYLQLVSAVLLITVLLFFRGGLGALPARLAFANARLRSIVNSATSRVGYRPRQRAYIGTSPKGMLPARLGAWILSLLPTRPGAIPAERLRPLDVVSLVNRLGGTPGEIVPLESRLEPKDSKAVRRLLASAAKEGVTLGEVDETGRRQPVLVAAEAVTVRFGGLTAVNEASLQVGSGEIVGLIGPNGAGKTTLFNSILGLNQPTAGSVKLFGRDVSGWQVHRRAALGVGRTFQIVQLFGDLSVFDNLLVATHLQNRTGLLGSLFVTRRARAAEREARARVRAVLRLMELEDFSDRRVGDLPFGVLRLVEVARTLVTGARVVCFDEPASGLDSTETESLIEWFKLLRQIGITLLVIEHDVDMVVRLCDYIYVLDQGRMISHGTATQIQSDPAVIASYLGTMEEAS